MKLFNDEIKYVCGGCIKDDDVRFESTSGGFFSAIVEVFCDENYVIFGAEADGLEVKHSYVLDKKDIGKYRKSKYAQSKIGTCYSDAKKFLLEGKKVLFSGTPCQIAALKKIVATIDCSKLLLVEVVCEGIPSPLYLDKFNQHILSKYGSEIGSIDYRYKGQSAFHNGKWDFQVMKLDLLNSNKCLTKDRWFNPFWSIWLQHLMSRPACYECHFARRERTADITLGDLWGVHLYCPDLYNKNSGASVAFASTNLGEQVLKACEQYVLGRELDVNDAIRYQAPMRTHISSNDNRSLFMKDLQSEMTYQEIVKKWAKKPDFKLLFQKYVWGNRQKMMIYNIKRKLKRGE